ncbi:MAG TPA: hypothetical protein VKN99_11605 [Polyangia bacterium]|nr:hypothetical protein [Polyangia bacterium]
MHCLTRFPHATISALTLLAVLGCGPPPEPYDRTSGSVGGKADDPAASCGGIDDIPCPDGQRCFHDPVTDHCSPAQAGSSCLGTCRFQCGGTAGGWITCPTSDLACVDDPTDSCDPTVGADCPGVCLPAPAPLTCQQRLEQFIAAHRSCSADSECVPICTLGVSCDGRSINQAGADAFQSELGDCVYARCMRPCSLIRRCSAGQCSP